MIHSKGRKAKIRNKKPEVVESVAVDLSAMETGEVVMLASQLGVWGPDMPRAELEAAIMAAQNG